MHAAVDPMSTLPAPARENVDRSGCTGAEHTSACDTGFRLVKRGPGGVCDYAAARIAARTPRGSTEKSSPLGCFTVESARRLSISLSAARARSGRSRCIAERMDQVIGGVGAIQRLVERTAVADVRLHRVRAWLAREATHLVACCDELVVERAADEPGGTGQRDHRSAISF